MTEACSAAPASKEPRNMARSSLLTATLVKKIDGRNSSPLERSPIELDRSIGSLRNGTSGWRRFLPRRPEPMVGNQYDTVALDDVDCCTTGTVVPLVNVYSRPTTPSSWTKEFVAIFSVLASERSPLRQSRSSSLEHVKCMSSSMYSASC